MIKSSLSCFLVAVEILQIIVEVCGAGAQKATKKCCVCGEDGSQIDLPDPGHDETHSGHPLVKVGHDPGRAVRVVLGQKSEVAKEFSNHKTVKEILSFNILS